MPGRFLYLVRHGDAAEGGSLSEAGEEQAKLVGTRLAEVPLTAIHHSPLPRTAQTAQIIASLMPAVPVYASDLLGDYLPPAPDADLLRDLPPAYCAIIASDSEQALAEGAARAAAALARYAVVPTTDTHELIVTHNQIIGWFVSQAVDAPPWRWLGLNQCNGAVSTLLYRSGRPAALLSFNDLSHLPPPLQWTGFPPELRP